MATPVPASSRLIRRCRQPQALRSRGASSSCRTSTGTACFSFPGIEACPDAADLYLLAVGIHEKAGRREDAEAVMQCLELVPGIITALSGGERPPSEVVGILDPLNGEALAYLYVLGGPGTRRLVERYVKTWKDITPRITGHDLAALGLKPSRAYADILARVRAERLDGKVRSREEELALAERLVRARQKG